MFKRTQLALLMALALGATGALANTKDNATTEGPGPHLSGQHQGQLQSGQKKQDAYLGPDGRVSTPSEQMAAARTPQEEGTSNASAQKRTDKTMRVADQPSAPNANLPQAERAGKPSLKGGAVSQTPSGTKAESGQAAAGNADKFGILIVPVHVVSDDSLNNGCWARIYENPEFGGSHLTVVGPVEVRNMEGSAASDWNGADSIITGRSASVTAYDNKDFRDRVATIGPSQRNAHMTGPFQKIQSLKVNCQGQG